MTIYVGEDIGQRYEDLKAKSEARGMPTDDTTMAQLLGVSLQDIQNYHNFKDTSFVPPEGYGTEYSQFPRSGIYVGKEKQEGSAFVPDAGYGTRHSVNAPSTPIVDASFVPDAGYGTSYNAPTRPPVGANQDPNQGVVSPAPIVPVGAGGMPDYGANVYSGGMPDYGAYGNTQVGGSSNSSGSGIPDDGANVYSGGILDDGAYGNTQVGGSSNNNSGIPDDGVNVYAGGIPDDGAYGNTQVSNSSNNNSGIPDDGRNVYSGGIPDDGAYGNNTQPPVGSGPMPDDGAYGNNTQPPIGSGPMPDDGAYGNNTQVGTPWVDNSTSYSEGREGGVSGGGGGSGGGSGGAGVGGVDGRGANQNTNVNVVAPAVEPVVDDSGTDDRPFDPTTIVDRSSGLADKYTDMVYEGDQRVNPYDTRRDAMLEGPMNAIDRAMERRVAEINHRFANTGNLGSPAYDQAMMDLQESVTAAKHKLESDFAFKAADMDDKMYGRTVDDMRSGIDTTRGLFDKDYEMMLNSYNREIDNYMRGVNWQTQDVMRRNEYQRAVEQDVMNYMNQLPVGQSDAFYESQYKEAMDRATKNHQNILTGVMGWGANS